MNPIKSETRAPVLYLPHGGGPLPILGDADHAHLVDFLGTIAARLGEPAAILVISAHWEEAQATVTGGERPGIIYDYYGFPAQAYDIRYPAPGHPGLACEIRELLTASGIDAKTDAERGFDHGLFIPLTLMYPDARIPCVQLSLLKNLDPRQHIALGKSLASLRRKDLLIIGSGMSFHNLRALFAPSAASRRQCEAFDEWLIETCRSRNFSPEEREYRLVEWERAPSARYCHPREEHLLPLHVCFGLAGVDTPVAEVVFNGDVMHSRVTALLW